MKVVAIGGTGLIGSKLVAGLGEHQFYEFVKAIADAGTVDGTVHVPPARIQPLASDDVAAAVGRVAVGQPLNGIRRRARGDHLQHVARRPVSTTRIPWYQGGTLDHLDCAACRHPA